MLVSAVTLLATEVEPLWFSVAPVVPRDGGGGGKAGTGGRRIITAKSVEGFGHAAKGCPEESAGPPFTLHTHTHTPPLCMPSQHSLN